MDSPATALSPWPSDMQPPKTLALTSVLLEDSLNWYGHLVATESHTVGKQAVHILLECFLVKDIISTSSFLPMLTPGEAFQGCQENKTGHVYFSVTVIFQWEKK